MSPIDPGRVVPLRPGIEFRSRIVRTSTVTASPIAPTTVRELPRTTDIEPSNVDFREPDSTGSIVYSNRLGNGIYSPGGAPGALVADDIATAATEGCVLDTMRFRVSGDPLGDGSGEGGFSVDFAFYSGCPSAGGFPLFLPITETFPDNGNYEVVFKPDLATEIEIPINAYFGLRFSRHLAGIVSGALPTVGFSADLYDFPQGHCDTNFGGFPNFDHGSYDLEITARNDCPGGACSSTCSGGDNAGKFGSSAKSVEA